MIRWNFDEMIAAEKGKKPRKRQTFEEDNLQVRCVDWFDRHYASCKLLLHHSPNEGKRSEFQGHRNKITGVRKGFPDLILLVANESSSFLALELKTKKGRQTPEQKEYERVINEMTTGRYVVVRCLEEFQDEIKKQLGDYGDRDYGFWR